MQQRHAMLKGVTRTAALGSPLVTLSWIDSRGYGTLVGVFPNLPLVQPRGTLGSAAANVAQYTFEVRSRPDNASTTFEFAKS